MHIVMHVILTAVYLNFNTVVVNENCWGHHGGFVSGQQDEKLVLAFRKV